MNIAWITPEAVEQQVKPQRLSTKELLAEMEAELRRGDGGPIEGGMEPEMATPVPLEIPRSYLCLGRTAMPAVSTATPAEPTETQNPSQTFFSFLSPARTIIGVMAEARKYCTEAAMKFILRASDALVDLLWGTDLYVIYSPDGKQLCDPHKDFLLVLEHMKGKHCGMGCTVRRVSDQVVLATRQPHKDMRIPD